MKSILTTIFLFLFANSAFAANLCDSSCNLTITFPSGGSIEATEALTFTFGTGGVLDLGATGTINAAVQPSSTDFSAGGTLALAVGESISFDAGGSLDLGVGGNIDYTNVSINTTGDVVIEATSAGMIAILDMAITAGSLTINSDATVENDLLLEGNTNFSGTGVLTVSSLGSLTAGVGVTSTVNILDYSIGPIINITPATEITIDGVLYQIEYVTVNGEQVSIVTAPDGTTGTLELKDGGFVFVPDPKEESSGGVSLLGMLALLVALMVYRSQERRLSIR